MTLNLPLSPPYSLSFLAPRHVVRQAPRKISIPSRIRCIIATQPCDPRAPRRLANWKPNIWDYNFVQSLNSDYKGEPYVKLADELKEDTRHLLDESVEPLDRLQLIDDLQRLGIAYHFENEIKKTLNTISDISSKKEEDGMDLYYTSLSFRLLRQHGYQVSQDVFNRFKDESGSFKACVSEDTKGLLSLYDASHLALEGEDVLDGARSFARRHLKDLKGNVSPNLAQRVKRALELPCHWRMPRLEARWYIDTYETNDGLNPLLLELSKLDFNMVQAIHQTDVKGASEWWRNLGLGEKLSFARQRILESFLWSLEVNFRERFGSLRKEITKAIQLITSIDDIYDIYGSLEEVELFTQVIDRWDINAMEGLPEYIKLCFLALFNTVNELAYVTMRDKGLDITPYLKKAWGDLSKAYLVEARWYNDGYTPSLDEYLRNGLISISGTVILTYTYFAVTQEITKEALESIQNYSNIIRWSATIFRLNDDLGTSTDELARGDVQKCIQCYMKDTGVAEAVAREQIKSLIGDLWKKMNNDLFSHPPFEQPFIECVVNLARVSQCMYLYGDGFGVPDRETKDRVLSCLVEPIPLKGHKLAIGYGNGGLV